VLRTTAELDALSALTRFSTPLTRLVIALTRFSEPLTRLVIALTPFSNVSERRSKVTERFVSYVTATK
jgi:hypothetical protein